MIFPSRPTTHDEEYDRSIFKIGDSSWHPPDERRPFRSCSYCGSIHPEDLLKRLETGDTLTGADWKYSWPHKFYLEGPVFGKWYNEHIKDVGYDEEALHKLLEALRVHSGILFTLVDDEVRGKQLKYMAPHQGYQR